MHEDLFELVYPLARRAVQVRAAAAVASGRVPAADREDLEQEALLRVWQALARYDASRASLRTFLERVAERRFPSLLRSRRRQLVIEPLDRHKPASADGIPAVEFRVDLERVLATLTEPDRRLARVLTEHTPSEASRILGLGRSTLYARMARLRRAFRQAGYAPPEAKRGER
ncbi:MAG: RNA polymerase sigma factor [Bryobacteraceae bacterium]